jgi:hypothetical protein
MLNSGSHGVNHLAIQCYILQRLFSARGMSGLMLPRPAFDTFNVDCCFDHDARWPCLCNRRPIMTECARGGAAMGI